MEIKRKVKRIIILLIVLAVMCGAFLAALWTKVLKINHPKGLKGADISAYQGETDWAVLSNEMDFVFVKATEGSSYKDEMFEANFKGARENGVIAGAYHFFSFDSSGATQAQNFIEAIDSTGLTEGMLPPVIDIEPYGQYLQEPKSARQVIPEVEMMIDMLYAHYRVKPIIYCTGKSYRLYKSGFEDCPLWERNVYFKPSHSDWTFWQYTDTEELEGYHGDERYIDMNVFKGSREELEAMCIKGET